MLSKKTLFSILGILASFKSAAQDEAAIRDYIFKYKDLAIAEMQRTGIPASIKLAQGIHETSAGTSVLVLKSNNHFGLKCKKEWKGMSVQHTDDAPNECFRKYTSSGESYKDQSDYLKSSPRYAALFQLEPTDYKGWAYGLKKAGYATNPKYAPVLIKLIEDYNLQEYTLIALGKPGKSDLTKNESPPAPLPITDEKKIAVTEPPSRTGPAQPEKNTETVTEKKIEIIPEPIQPLYPAGEFKINETRVVFVTMGTPYLSIALQYNIPLARIFEFNDMKQTEAADKDRLIYLMRKRKTGANEFHIIQPGETLHDIAQTEAIRIESLLEYNHLTYNQKPAIGEKLNLFTRAPAPPRLALNEHSNLDYMQMNKVQTTVILKSEPTTHVVAPKETIYSIARRYNVKIEDIVKWNSLQEYALKTGQQLKIFKL
jgi:LysM repeat protein